MNYDFSKLPKFDNTTFQGLIFSLQAYWASLGCVIMQPLDLEVGAGTFHPATFLRALDGKDWRAAYVQGCRRPGDGRYGENPNRGQFYFQFQVVLQPAPFNIQDLYLDSLRYLGVDTSVDDIRFVESDWESPALGAWGLGWEVWQNGMEISQFTYFQQIGGLPCRPIMGELTYGLERVAMYLQGRDMYQLVWSRDGDKEITYGDILLVNEQQMSAYNFRHANVELLLTTVEACYSSCYSLLEQDLSWAAYEMVLKASHAFNLLDARGALSVSERQRLLLQIRKMAADVASSYVQYVKDSDANRSNF